MRCRKLILIVRVFFKFPICWTKEELSCNQLMLLDNGILHLRKLSAGYKLLSFFELKIWDVTSQNECIALARCHTTQKLTQSTKYPHRRSPHLPITKRPHYTRAKKNYTPHRPRSITLCQTTWKGPQAPWYRHHSHQTSSTFKTRHWTPFISWGVASAFPFDNVWNKWPFYPLSSFLLFYVRYFNLAVCRGKSGLSIRAVSLFPVAGRHPWTR